MKKEILQELMTDTELDLVAGGEGRDWYYRPETTEVEDHDNPGKKIISKGYIVEGEYQATGAKISTRFLTVDSFDRFRRNNADDCFYEGSLNISKVA